MILLDLQQAIPRRLIHYLSVEEWLALHIEEGQEYLLLWNTLPTVIFGRHQVMENEVNMPYCQAEGIQMFRRKSGGGCVYSDEGNLMISFVTYRREPQVVFHDYLEMIRQLLEQLGLPAVTTAHNDILVNDKKVSGNACYQTERGCIVHGTMLFSVDYNRLTQAITPSAEKLAKHGVASVRQRVVNLHDLGLDMETFRTHCVRTLCGEKKRVLRPEELAEIDAIEQSYIELI